MQKPSSLRPGALKSRIYVMIVTIALGLLVSGCGDEPETDSQSTTDSPQMIERQAPRSTSNEAAATPDDNENFRVMPEIEGSLEQDGMGLETIIDASNKQAYADSLQWISEDVSKEQFDRLESSIRYIHMYDSSVLGSESRLLSLIDGKTGSELIEHAKKLRDQRRGN